MYVCMYVWKDARRGMGSANNRTDFGLVLIALALIDL